MLSFFIIFLIVELPYTFILLLGIFLNHFYPKSIIGELKEFPRVVINLTCYSEGDLIELAIESIVNQTYPLDKITALVTIDGGSKYGDKSTILW